jgi:hypothetical protein
VKPTTGLRTFAFAYWYKGEPKADDEFHYAKWRGRWHLLKGMYIVARQPVLKANESPPIESDFFRFCDIFFQKPQEKIIERAKTFDDEMQFFTAYWFTKEMDET